MESFREVNNNILKEWFEFREDTILSSFSVHDKTYSDSFTEYTNKIMKNVPKKNKQYVQKLLNKLDKCFIDYLCYCNEKYYRNGFVDGMQIVTGCFEK